MNATLRLLDLLGALNQRVGSLGVFLASLLVGLMAVIVILGVFFRYVLNDSITWVEDVALIMMTTTAFIVAPYAYRNGANVAIEIVTAALPTLVTHLLKLLVNVLILWIIYRYFLESLALVKRGFSIRVNTVPIAWAWPYMIVPAAFFAMALTAIELIGRDLWALMFRSPAADLQDLPPAEGE